MTSAYSSPPRIIVGYSPSSQKPAPLAQTVYRVSNQHYNGNENGDDVLSSCEEQNDMKSHHIFVHDSSQNYDRHESQHQQSISGDNGEVRLVMYPHAVPNGSKQTEIKVVELPSPSSIPAYALEPSSIQSGHSHHYSAISSMPSSYAPQGTVEYVVVHDQRSLMSDQLNSRVHIVENQSLNGASNFHYTPKQEPDPIPVGRKKKDLERKRRKRAEETDMDAESRRAKNLAAKRRRLEKESEEERMRRRARDAETKRLRRQRETPEQRKKRLTRDSERMRRTRRLKKLLGPNATLSDPEILKQHGITLEDLDTEPPKRKKPKEPNSLSKQSLLPDHMNGDSSGETVLIQTQIEEPALYLSNPKQYINGNMQSSSNGRTQIVVSRNIPSHVETASRQSLPASTHSLPQQNYEIRRTVPAPATPTQHHVIGHASTMPIPITVEPGTQVVTLHLSIPNTQQQHILHLPQSSLPQHIIVQRQPIPQPSTSAIEIPHASAHLSHQQPNIVQAVHSYPQVVTRNITEEYQPPQQQHVRISTTTRRSSSTTVPAYIGKTQIHDLNRQPVDVLPIHGETDDKPMLSEEQIMRRRRNAERSRRRRALETPQQRAERNRRTAERMRNRRAKLAAERQNRGDITVQRPIHPLSVDRFEEIFQSVLSQCTKTEVKSELDQMESDTNNGEALVEMRTLVSSSQSQMSPGGPMEDREMFSSHEQNLSMCSEISLNSLSSQSIYDQSTPEYTHQTSEYDDHLASPRLDDREEHSERDSQSYEPRFEGL